MRFPLLVLTCLALALSASPAAAQCGAGASECMGCHEGRGARPVVADGTPWHADHAFGDFCAICHGGDPSATDAAAAHASLFAPLDHPADACGSCHGAASAGLSERYAAAVTVGRPRSVPPGGAGGLVPWRNLVLATFVVVLGVGGGAYVVHHERALRGGAS